MEPVKRSVAIIRPKAPFIKWANNWLAFGENKYAPEYFTDDCMVILIPLMPTEPLHTHTAGERYIHDAWDAIFVENLRRWNPNEYIWPQPRTRKMFGEWFTVEFHTLVLDAVKPIAE